MKKVWILVLACVLSSCEYFKEKVDLVVFNANIYTVDEGFSKAQAFAINKGKFIAVGSTEEIRDVYTSDRLFDADGRTITPGLIDAHCHFYGLGLNQQLVDLTGTKSYGEVLERVQRFQEENPKEFIQGRGWDQNDWEIKEFPTKKELDERYPDIPVVLERVDGHAYLVNQAALDRAGIKWNTRVDGGEIVRGPFGITGVLVDNPMRLIDSIMPPPNLQTKVQALKDAERICFNYGLTTVNDAGLDRATIELIDSLQQIGELSIRVYAMVSNIPDDVDHFIYKGPMKTDRLNVRSVKVYGDGALGSRGAVLKKPYTDKWGHYGAMVTPVEEIEKLAERIAISEYQMNTHAIGDSANAVVLRSYQKVLKDRPDRRWKVEHAQLVDSLDFDYFGEGIIPSIQPTHATSDMYWAEDRVGPDRMKGAYAYKKLLDKAGMVALGTDFPVERVSPFLTFYAAVARKDTEGYPEAGFQIQDALSRQEALKGMTIWAAHSNFEENEKGSIEVGKFADFTIYSADLMTVPLSEIPNIQAEQTFIGGEVAE
ncbi:amidohydrolase [Flavobacteriaceae bacterium TP-CH-4]|uniref:Amidohydrolase n=1 Tax=Pelagihabitans pacificus TaxID=2696054 RepID=A0A967AQ78_9FLAO|nr:amidohydrolase [Pelagihabitans pacificus]NHF57982.1 amidohydrolase [Pelagihabitans pacificus]